ncbi:GDP-mannose 4,6-dehydratase [Candidatus Marinimicrobia bacterium]|nr:GDP-mannose 4,6-dehydratase [Candidatus Neomarinimicrobiota bacterium]
MKKAFISGISGQDGAYLAELLLSKGYEVSGGERRSASGSLWRLEKLGISNEVKIYDFELSEFSNIKNIVEKINPDEFYNLAAQSFVGSSFDVPIMTSDVTGLGCLRVLEAIRHFNKDIKFYQASSSEMFGNVQAIPQDESTPFYPRSPYGVAKLFGHWATINYRESYDMFACSGILFNHESPLRGEEFVTRKITKALSRIKLGLQEKLELGNLDAKRDWGFAGDYVQGMYKMLQHDIPDDYVLSTNETHSIRDFINLSCEKLNIKLDWKGEGLNEHAIDEGSGKIIISINKRFYRPAEVDLLIGDSSKARKILKWENKVSFDKLVSMMIESDLEAQKNII